MNKEIKLNLERLHSLNYKHLQSTSLKEMFNQLIKDNPKPLKINLGFISNIFDDEETKLFRIAKNDSTLISAFKKAQKVKYNEREELESLKSDLKESFNIIKEKIETENIEYQNQIIFLEYDYEPEASLSGFGEGEYPILQNPEYFEFNYKEELYNGVGNVSYASIWKNLTAFTEALEELNVDDAVIDTELYQSLLNATKFKTYLLLHEAFEELGGKLFEGINIKKPLMIYGNEHGCEAINIYILE